MKGFLPGHTFSLKHGHHRNGKPSPTYFTYRGMIGRCYYPQNASYKRYGALGIKVCKRWLGPNGFKNFLADMGERPSGMTLDRENKTGNYTPKNCRWATNHQQHRDHVKICDLGVLLLRYMWKRGACNRDLAHAFGVDQSIASRIARGQIRTTAWEGIV